ncbi:hypothetical protein HU147_14540 [Planomicrobium chinense]|uniref:hypothetical protein n=1 Tax=Planococcus chinensis TaxID=272917 RepID=UPI001CC58721|nr:hypothetical protein [Planococcus chinensis]MBZ5202424.1 hypothetical protein [Planococcus chinensis]MCP2036224.1 hypothetical protein [Planomicrobium sp. HSC-17F08]
MYDFVDQKRIIYITFAIILLISSLFAPVAIFYPLKVIFITPEALSVGTSYISLITGGLGIALIAAGLFALALIEMRMKKYLAAALLFVAGVAGMLLSLSDYYYMTSDEFIYNGPFSISSQSYEWEDFEKIEERIGKEDNTQSVQSVAMYLKNGEVIEMSSGKIFEMRGDLANRIEQAGGLYERIDLEQ